MSTDDSPTLHKVTFWICSLCLDGAGGECHVPGCLFVFADAPLPSSAGPSMREKIVGLGSIDGVTTYIAVLTARFELGERDLAQRLSWARTKLEELEGAS